MRRVGCPERNTKRARRGEKAQPWPRWAEAYRAYRDATLDGFPNAPSARLTTSYTPCKCVSSIAPGVKGRPRAKPSLPMPSAERTPSSSWPPLDRPAARYTLPQYSLRHLHSRAMALSLATGVPAGMQVHYSLSHLAPLPKDSSIRAERCHCLLRQS